MKNIQKKFFIENKKIIGEEIFKKVNKLLDINGKLNIENLTNSINTSSLKKHDP